jgi:hypothetical protein
VGAGAAKKTKHTRFGGFLFLEILMKSMRLSLAIIAISLTALIGGFFSSSAQAGPLTDYAQNKLVDYLFRGQASTAPSTWYVALYTACPTDSTAGTEVTNANGYARQSVGVNALTNWAATQGGTAVSSGTAGTTSNLAAINFPTVTTSSWGTINCWGLVDSGTWGAGNIWVYATVTVPPTLTVGSTASFAIGQLTFQLGN